MNLIPENELRHSPVVANCRMNRKRKLTGINSYEKEIGINIEGYLGEKREPKSSTVRWLDICCGEGNALIELSTRLKDSHQSDGIELVGIDLVGMFNHYDSTETPFLHLVETPIETWKTSQEYDLITCIHGIHYLGDKLGIIQKIVSMLASNGRFYGNLDLENVPDESDHSLSKWVREQWGQMGWEYQSRKRLLKIQGKRHWPITWQYLGADDAAGPNYTGQEVVNSYYRITGKTIGK